MPLSADQNNVIRGELKKAAMPAIWTYEVQRGKHKGARKPITYSGLRRVIRNALSEADIKDFRIHDLRHDFATKLLRYTRNLALVKAALGHGDISSTVRYAHVLDEEIAQGMQGLGTKLPEWSQNPVSNTQRSRK
jgi:integrase